jgi:hypothetical protein
VDYAKQIHAFPEEKPKSFCAKTAKELFSRRFDNFVPALSATAQAARLLGGYRGIDIPRSPFAIFCGD